MRETRLSNSLGSLNGQYGILFALRHCLRVKSSNYWAKVGQVVSIWEHLPLTQAYKTSARIYFSIDLSFCEIVGRQTISMRSSVGSLLHLLFTVQEYLNYVDIRNIVDWTTRRFITSNYSLNGCQIILITWEKLHTFVLMRTYFIRINWWSKLNDWAQIHTWLANTELHLTRARNPRNIISGA